LSGEPLMGPARDFGGLGSFQHCTPIFRTVQLLFRITGQ
jgi:hypothetical protein